MSFVINPFVFAAAGLTTLSFANSAISTGTTITGPANIIAGDLIVLLDSAVNTGTTAPTTVVPTGFSSIINTNGNVPTIGPAIRQIASYKLADGSEASATITGMNGNSTDDKVLLLFRGNIPAATITPASAAGQYSEGNPTLQTVSSNGGVAPLIVFGAYGTTSGSVDPRTFSVTKDFEVNSGTSTYFVGHIYDSSPVNVDVDMDDEGSGNLLQSFYLQVA